MDRSAFFKPLALITLLSFAISACSKIESIQQTNASCASRVSPAYAGPSERSYCAGPIATTGTTVTISGVAEYRAYQQSGSGLGAAATFPIRRAEVEIYSSGGTLLQCGETNGSGAYSLTIPQSSETVSVKVNARSNNAYLKASVLDCPEENNLYSVTETTTANSNQTVNLLASETGSTLGGAFNILDQLLNTNTFLVSKLSTCSGTYSGCTDVSSSSLPPKVSVYWTVGFNPNVYQGTPNKGISFYVTGYDRLFILGGINGNTSTQDTDHFDNSIIIHEYGHFLEDNFTISDTPGGSHSGTKQIDPRLAWSEAWGNFIQSAVLDNPYYIDSKGSPAGTSTNLLNIPIEDLSSYCSTPTNQGCDLPTFSYEGNFREFAITRLLWDVHDTDASPEDDDNDGVENEFSAIWALMTSTSALKNTAEAFRNIGLLLEIQDEDNVGSSWSSLLSNSQHRHGDTIEYARYVDNTGACAARTMTPYDDANDDGTFSKANLLRNNDFLLYNHSGGAFNLVLTYSTPDAGAGEEVEADLDLYVYSGYARYGNANDMNGYSQEYYDNDQTTSETETVSNTLSAGNYLINVKGYTGVWQYSSSAPNYAACTDSSILTPCPVGHASCSGNAYIGSSSVRICHNERIPAGDGLTYTLQVNGDTLCDAARP